MPREDLLGFRSEGMLPPPEQLRGDPRLLATSDTDFPFSVTSFTAAKRLRKYGAEVLTFVEFEGVPSSNNHAEREVRPAVLMRKASYGSRSARGRRRGASR